MKTLRNTDEWVGLLVLLCGALFIAAALHAGFVSGWFRPVANLRVLLPETGSLGLSAGADVQVLGTSVGTVHRIVVDPSQRMYAEVDLDEKATVYIRRDSKAVVKKTFGVAGAAFLDVSRGTGEPLDWSFAVIDASNERDPTENIGAMIDEAKLKIFPVLDDAGRAMRALAEIAEGIEQGRGSVGRLVKDDALADQLAEILASVKTATDQANTELGQIRALTSSTVKPELLAGVLRRADETMASVQAAARDLAATAAHLPAISRNVAGMTADLPALLAQTQQSFAELERTLYQLRHTWPLTGGAAPDAHRLSPSEVKP